MNKSVLTVQRGGFFKWLLAITVMADLFFIGLVGYSLRQSWLRNEERAEITTQNLSLVFAGGIAGVIDDIDLAVLTVADEVEKQFAAGGINSQTLNTFIAHSKAHLPIIDGLHVVNAQGENLYGTGANLGAQVSMSDRSLCIWLRSDPKAGLVISKPVQGDGKKWSIIFARRVNQSDGSFAGLVCGTITLEQLIKTFSTVDVGKHGALALRDDELVLIARNPVPKDTENLIGKKNASPELQKAIQAQKESGTFRSQAFDKIKRVYSYCKVSNYPLYAIAGLSTDEYRAGWWNRAVYEMTLTVIFFLGSFLSAWLVYRYWMSINSAGQELARQKESLNNERALLRTLVDHLPVSVYLKDSATRKTLANPVDLRNLGVSSEAEALGKLDSDFFPPEQAAGFIADDQHVIHTGQPVLNREEKITRPDGSTRWILTSKVPLTDSAGNVTGLAGIGLDITERKRLEEQLRRSQRLEAVGQLAGGVAHDFNNILAVIQLQASLLKMAEGLSDEHRGHARDIEQASERAAKLTRQLLQFSRKEALRQRDLDLSEVVGSIFKMLERILGGQILVQFKFSAQPLLIHADEGMLEQVLMNLTVNARDAMPRGGRLIIETTAVEFDAVTAKQAAQGRTGAFACLSVTDTGCGIPPEILPKIFEPFFTTKDVGKGSGLGLSAVFGIVQEHRGWINVYSEVGKGTTFRIYLPRLDQSSDKKTVALPPAAIRAGDEIILLVEDDADVRDSLRGTLSRLGYHVLEAATGAEALQVWKQHHAEIRLLLTDLMMPGGMNGLDLAKQLLQQNPKLKVVYASGYSAGITSHNNDLLLQEGVNFIAKPFDSQKLAQILRNCLDNN